MRIVSAGFEQIATEKSIETTSWCKAAVMNECNKSSEGQN
jgi:hypothetical protein